MKILLTALAVVSIISGASPAFAARGDETSTRQTVEKQAKDAKRQAEKQAKEAKKQAEKQARTAKRQVKKSSKEINRSAGNLKKGMGQ